MIVLFKDLANYKTEVGPKAWNLKLLKDMGLNVPDFFVLPCTSIQKLDSQKINNESYKKIQREIAESSHSFRFAVRSAALNEDTENSSQAGQFLTEINVSNADLPAAIRKIINQAKSLLNGELKKLSIIIQDYVVAEMAGVCFTRNPIGGREMIIEYHKGIGEDVVSGKIRPQKLSLFWNESTKKLEFKNHVESFKKIEGYFQSPQDIEWAVKDNQLSLLQTRPITTLTKQDLQKFNYLDSVLPAKEFLYEKTEISEIAPRPTPFTLSLLEKIYTSGGPVEAVYASLDIKYSADYFLKIVGNELYSDRELEIKTLLPAYSYFPNGTVGIKNYFAIFKTLKNIFYLQKINLNKTEELFKKLEPLFKSDPDGDSSIINVFLKNYKLIFKINLLSAKALKDLEAAADQNQISVTSLFSLANKQSYHLVLETKDFLGNSLEISDETSFISSRRTTLNSSEQTSIKKLSKLKQAYLSQLAEKAQDYSDLREYGRWLTVKYISNIRKFLLKTAVQQNFSNPKNIYFAKIDEIGKISENELEKRKNKYKQFNKFSLPNKLTNLERTTGTAAEGVSSGTAQGIVVNENQIDKSDTKVILYTKILSPNLAVYFPYIQGIISEQGGLLSHLAIIAREQHIPVIITQTPPELGIQVQMDADKAEIKVLPST